MNSRISVSVSPEQWIAENRIHRKDRGRSGKTPYLGQDGSPVMRNARMFFPGFKHVRIDGNELEPQVPAPMEMEPSGFRNISLRRSFPFI